MLLPKKYGEYFVFCENTRMFYIISDFLPKITLIKKPKRRRKKKNSSLTWQHLVSISPFSLFPFRSLSHTNSIQYLSPSLSLSPPTNQHILSLSLSTLSFCSSRGVVLLGSEAQNVGGDFESRAVGSSSPRWLLRPLRRGFEASDEQLQSFVADTSNLFSLIFVFPKKEKKKKTISKELCVC